MMEAAQANRRDGSSRRSSRSAGPGSSIRSRSEKGTRNEKLARVGYIDESRGFRKHSRGSSCSGGRRGDGGGKRVAGTNTRNNVDGAESAEGSNRISDGESRSSSLSTTTSSESALGGRTTTTRRSRSIEVGGGTSSTMLSESENTIQ